MKNKLTKLVLVLACTVSVFSCKKDDDASAGVSGTCQSCTVSTGEIENTTQYCDQGNGKMTVTNGEFEMEQNIPGGNFETFIEGIKIAGTCTAQ